MHVEQYGKSTCPTVLVLVVDFATVYVFVVVGAVPMRQEQALLMLLDAYGSVRFTFAPALTVVVTVVSTLR